MIKQVSIIKKEKNYVKLLFYVEEYGKTYQITFKYFYTLDTPEAIYKEFISDVKIEIPKEKFLENLKPFAKKNGRITRITKL